MARQKVKICPRCKDRPKYKSYGYCRDCKNERTIEARANGGVGIDCQRVGRKIGAGDCVFDKIRCAGCKVAVEGNPKATPGFTLEEMREQALTGSGDGYDIT